MGRLRGIRLWDYKQENLENKREKRVIMEEFSKEGPKNRNMGLFSSAYNLQDLSSVDGKKTAQGLLATDHVILNHGQVTWTTPGLAPPSPNYLFIRKKRLMAMGERRHSRRTSKVPIHHSLVHWVRAKRYCDTLSKLKEAIWKKRLGLLRSGVLLLDD
ncbi:hypothetical protein TNCV_1611201 [Trichonephila clavipes]|nr:hypothetical protein TNCV_1611201 [Trichonephila clavipes]